MLLFLVDVTIRDQVRVQCIGFHFVKLILTQSKRPDRLMNTSRLFSAHCISM